MQTKILTVHDIEKAAEYISDGELVAFPTETVYGLGANALSTDAAKKIYAAKGRPSDNPLIVHISDKQELKAIATVPENHEELCEKIMKEFWPGPLTIILPKTAIIPYEVSGGLETVAVRLPSHAFARDLIRTSGCPIAAPSANTSGKPSGTAFDHVYDDFDSKIAAIIRSDDCEIGLESSVIDLSGETPLLLRPGGLDYESLLRVIPHLEIGYGDSGDSTESVKSPGMKYKHYCPEAEIILFELGCTGKMKQYKTDPTLSGKKILEIHPEEIPNFGHKLFSLLRNADKDGYDIILIGAVEEVGNGRTIMNRLRKSASHIVHPNA